MYKIIYNDNVIDVVKDLKYLRYLEKSNHYVTTDSSSANCIQGSNDVVYWLQGTKFHLEVHLLPVKGYDLVLGVPWLATLGDIKWNFLKLSMEFRHAGDWCRLQGDREAVQVMDSKEVAKLSS